MEIQRLVEQRYILDKEDIENITGGIIFWKFDDLMFSFVGNQSESKIINEEFWEIFERKALEYVLNTYNIDLSDLKLRVSDSYNFFRAYVLPTIEFYTELEEKNYMRN